MNDELPYREGVVAAFCDEDGNVLIARRFGTTDSWQFPQGGIELGETPEKAVFREVYEELGCDKFDILKTVPDWIPYDFPLTFIHSSKVAEKYRGQKQRWFLCRFHPGFGPDLNQASDKAFDAVKWVKPEEILDVIVQFKNPAYLTALTALGLLLPA